MTLAEATPIPREVAKNTSFEFTEDHVAMAIVDMESEIGAWIDNAKCLPESYTVSVNHQIDSLRGKIAVIRTHSPEHIVRIAEGVIDNFFRNRADFSTEKEDRERIAWIKERYPQVVHLNYLLNKHPKGSLVTWALTLINS